MELSYYLKVVKMKIAIKIEKNSHEKLSCSHLTSN